jgi:peptidyl-prolyl cis-trans isomerase SurA
MTIKHLLIIDTETTGLDPRTERLVEVGLRGRPAGRLPVGLEVLAPGEVREEQLSPPPLRALIASLPPRQASQPIVAPDGIAVIMVCSRERRNEAEVTPAMARAQIVRERADLLSRQTQRDLRRRAQIEQRS